MANTKITNLTSLTPATGDEIPVNRAGSDGKITVGGIQTPLLADVQADGNNLVFEEGDGLYTPSAKGYDAKVLVLSDGTSNDGDDNYGYLEIANADHVEEVQIRAKNAGLGSHTPIALVPFGTDGIRVRWGNITTTFPKFELISTSDNDVAPFYQVSKYSASPAAGDFVGGMECWGFDSGAATHIFGGIWFRAYAVTAGSEYGYATITTCVNGTDEVEQFHVGDGVVIGSSVTAWPGAGNLHLKSNTGILSLGSTADLFLSRNAAANLRLGAAAAASPVAQTLSVQNVVAGTSDTAGANFTINGSIGTGTGAGGSFIVQLAGAGSTGSSQNSLSAALTITTTGTTIKNVTGAQQVLTLDSNATVAKLNFANGGAAAANIEIQNGGTDIIQISGVPPTISIPSASVFAWTNGSAPYDTSDVLLSRQEAGCLKIAGADDAGCILYDGKTFAKLPGTPVAGMVAYVTDGNTGTWGATQTGGGSTKTLVWYNGTNWTVVGA